MLDIRLLIQFATLAEELSFTRAAQKLGVAQPWLSSRIRNLEQQLGVTLFERTTRSVSLTEKGQWLHEIVRPLVIAANRAVSEAERLRLDEAGHLRIGMPPLGARDRQQEALLARFGQLNRHVVVELEPAFPMTAVDQLRRGLMDLCFLIHPFDDYGLEWLRLHHLELAVLMHGHDPLAARTELRAPDLAGRRLAVIARSGNSIVADYIQQDLAAQGVELVRVPELRRSLLFQPAFGDDLLVLTLVAPPIEARLRDGVVRRKLHDAPKLQLGLARRQASEYPRPVERLWALAIEAGGA
ncbi:MAG: LysR family transcriptional regulator [Paracoccaceae bacterium]